MTEDRRNDTHLTIIAAVAGSAVLLICLVTWATLVYDPNRGTFGDMFGGTNALFSGLAFVGLIYTILLQRSELALTREELKGQRTALEQQLQAQMRPLVQVYTEIHREVLLTLCVRNSGIGVAKNLSLRISDNAELVTNKGKLSAFPAFVRNVPNFGPGEAFRYTLKSGLKLSDDENEQIEIMARYESHSGQEFKESFIIDLRPYLSTLILPTERDLLEKISDDIAKSIR